MSKEFRHFLNVDNPIGVCFAERPGGEKVYDDL